MLPAARRLFVVSTALKPAKIASNDTVQPLTRPALSIRNVRKSYGAVEVLHRVDLDVGVGERVALMGRSGSGKSTLLNCICGIEPFNEGRSSWAAKRSAAWIRFA